MIFLLYKGTSALIIYVYFQLPGSTEILCIHVQQWWQIKYKMSLSRFTQSTEHNVSIMSSPAGLVQQRSWSWSGCQTSLARPASLGWWIQPEWIVSRLNFHVFFVLWRSSGFSALLVSRMVPRSPPKIHTPLKSPFYFMVLPLTPSSSSLPPRSAKADHTFCLS